jgi:hypothetical protein
MTDGDPGPSRQSANNVPLDVGHAGPDIPGRGIRPHLLGPATVGAGPGRSNERDADRPEMERVQGGGGTGRAENKAWCYG